jgi:membrane protease YdiL (CAAX protease family)
MTIINKCTLLYEAILCSFAFMVFSLLIHYDFPSRFIAFVALLPPAYIIGKNLKSLSDLKRITGGVPTLRNFLIFSVIGFTGGTLFAVLYRWHLDVTLFPHSIYAFVIVGALIGSIEELVFRGYIQGSVSNINSTFSILFSTISHTGYKCCLFMSPAITVGTHIGFLAFWTFTAGLLFGTIRHYTKSILPSLIAHSLFDILVYAECLRAPWWVW